MRKRVVFEELSSRMSEPPKLRGEQEATVYFSNPLMSDTEADWSPIHDAAFNGRLLALSTLIKQSTAVNLTTLDGVTPLHAACQQGHRACIQLLIEHGANVNAAMLNGGTPLSEASSRGHEAVVDLLLQHGAQPRS